MRTKKTGQNGFIMLLVVAVLALIAIYMIILTNDSNTIIFQTNRAYLEACKQNLTASGLIWVKKNLKDSKSKTGAVELDTSDMNIKGATLSVAVSAVPKGKAQIEIDTFCSKARQHLTSAEKFTVEYKP
jgi:hypothetical protein